MFARLLVWGLQRANLASRVSLQGAARTPYANVLQDCFAHARTAFLLLRVPSTAHVCARCVVVWCVAQARACCGRVSLLIRLLFVMCGCGSAACCNLLVLTDLHHNASLLLIVLAKQPQPGRAPGRSETKQPAGMLLQLHRTAGLAPGRIRATGGVCAVLHTAQSRGQLLLPAHRRCGVRCWAGAAEAAGACIGVAAAPRRPDQLPC